MPYDVRKPTLVTLLYIGRTKKLILIGKKKAGVTLAVLGCIGQALSCSFVPIPGALHKLCFIKKIYY